jgi:hypothetical protein
MTLHMMLITTNDSSPILGVTMLVVVQWSTSHTYMLHYYGVDVYIYKIYIYMCVYMDV